MTQQRPTPGPLDSPYASPPASPYAGQPYPPPAYPPAYSAYANEYYAPWGRRVGAYLLDYLLLLLGWVLTVIGLALATPTSGSRSRTASSASAVGWVLALVGCVLMLGLVIWNRYVRAGRTSQSWGKKVLGIRLVRESDPHPIGAGMAFARDLAHIVDGFLPRVPLAALGRQAADLPGQDLLDRGARALTPGSALARPICSGWRGYARPSRS